MTTDIRELIDPTNEELDSTFATVVAGWTEVKPSIKPDEMGDGDVAYLHGRAPRCADVLSIVPNYTFFVDSVLPYLQHFDWWRDQSGALMVEGVAVRAGYNPAVDGRFCLAKSMVVAILRANGVKVTFTKR